MHLLGDILDLVGLILRKRIDGNARMKKRDDNLQLSLQMDSGLILLAIDGDLCTKPSLPHRLEGLVQQVIG